MDGHGRTPSILDQCTLIRLETLTRRQSNKFSTPNLLSLINMTARRYHSRGGDWLRINFHRTNYGVHEPLNDAVWHFNWVTGLFDFHLSRNQFFNHPRSVL
jgi:hypothetical protein